MTHNNSNNNGRGKSNDGPRGEVYNYTNIQTTQQSTWLATGFDLQRNKN